MMIFTLKWSFVLRFEVLVPLVESSRLEFDDERYWCCTVIASQSLNFQQKMRENVGLPQTSSMLLKSQESLLYHYVMVNSGPPSLLL